MFFKTIFKKRKKLLINPSFQIPFISWMMGIALTEILIFYSAHLYFFKLYIDKGTQAGLSLNHIFFKFLSDQYKSMNFIFLMTAIITILFILITGIILSHRIAGPIYRLCRHMSHNYSDDNYQEIHFRPNDYFKELSTSYNQHLQNLRQNQKKEKNHKHQ